VVLHQGAVDIGQGSSTAMTQILADAMGVAADVIILESADTHRSPDAGKTSASRQTFVSGNATYRAGRDLRRRLLAELSASDDAHLELEHGRALVNDQGTVRVLELGDMPIDRDGYVLSATATYDPPTTPLDDDGQGEPYAVFGFGAQLVELEVDTATGRVRLVRIVAAHDVGRAVNPTLIEGQIEGGIAQGIGFALMEEYVPGRNDNLHDYLIPTIGDVPEIVSILVESSDPHGPYGAKGIGEHTLIATAPAILNAIRDATGAAIRQVPATPDRVLAAIRAR
jgi:CO/xanthine dehydrogenase Mo-binding subunit